MGRLGEGIGWLVIRYKKLPERGGDLWRKFFGETLLGNMGRFTFVCKFCILFLMNIFTEYSKNFSWRFWDNIADIFL